MRQVVPWNLSWSEGEFLNFISQLKLDWNPEGKKQGRRLGWSRWQIGGLARQVPLHQGRNLSYLWMQCLMWWFRLIFENYVLFSTAIWARIHIILGNSQVFVNGWERIVLLTAEHLWHSNGQSWGFPLMSENQNFPTLNHLPSDWQPHRTTTRKVNAPD